MGTGRGIAFGIEQGARNFLDSFYAAKDYKQQSKFRKLAPIIQMAMQQISDPDIELDQKIKAVNTLPDILGVKTDVPLATMWGLDKLAEQQVQVGTKRLAPDVPQINPETKQREMVPPPEQQNLERPVLTRRGQLSRNELSTVKALQLHKAEQEDQFQRQFKLAQVQADLQSKVLEKNGWKSNGDWTYNENDKTWVQEWFNPITKENYQQKLQPGIVPETVILKQIQAGGKQGGVSAAYRNLRTAIATSMGLEEDDPKVQLATANLWKDKFEKQVDWLKQGVAGTRPIPQGQRESLGLQKLGIQQKHNELVASASAADEAVNSKATVKNQAWQDAANAKADFDKIKEDYEPDEKEYQIAQSAYNRAVDDARRAEADYQTALKSANKLKEQVRLSSEQLAGTGLNPRGITTETSNISPRMKVRIKIFKEQNPNFKGTDEEAAAILASQGYKD